MQYRIVGIQMINNDWQQIELDPMGTVGLPEHVYRSTLVIKAPVLHPLHVNQVIDIDFGAT